MNEIKLKIYCSTCDCVVVSEGHDARCRPKTVKGEWNRARRCAWIGDSVHRMDVQLAVQLLGAETARWEIETQAYISNAAQAAYIRKLEPAFVMRSDHAAGTEFESRYFGDFRNAYLFITFPTCFERVLAAWQPPVLSID